MARNRGIENVLANAERRLWGIVAQFYSCEFCTQTTLDVLTNPATVPLIFWDWYLRIHPSVAAHKAEEIRHAIARGGAWGKGWQVLLERIEVTITFLCLAGSWVPTSLVLSISGLLRSMPSRNAPLANPRGSTSKKPARCTRLAKQSEPCVPTGLQLSQRVLSGHVHGWRTGVPPPGSSPGTKPSRKTSRTVASGP
jgi:hypothetical protein